MYPSFSEEACEPVADAFYEVLEIIKTSYKPREIL
jgi:hypothetical protein